MNDEPNLSDPTQHLAELVSPLIDEYDSADLCGSLLMFAGTLGQGNFTREQFLELATTAWDTMTQIAAAAREEGD